MSKSDISVELWIVREDLWYYLLATDRMCHLLNNVAVYPGPVGYWHIQVRMCTFDMTLILTIQYLISLLSYIPPVYALMC